MKKYTIFITVYLYLISQSSFLVSGQQNLVDSVSWDHTIISEADKWQYLLVNYSNGDHSSSWPEKKQALLNLTEKFPNSQWADDAVLLLAGDQAIIENDIEGAILMLQETIASNPNSHTIITNWHPKRGCRISDAWLMWAPGLVTLKSDRTIRTSFPFNQDDNISILEQEVLTYFEHTMQHPQKTKDVAQYLIALMTLYGGDTLNAIAKLEYLISEYPDLSDIRTIDYQAAQGIHGHLIDCEPPFDQQPIWRIQYSACMLLINLYLQIDEIDKAILLSSRFAVECSPDGWYWNINLFVGEIFALHGARNLASEQYDLSLKGIDRIVEDQSVRKKDLFEQGYMAKPATFLSWQDEALKPFAGTITQIEDLLKQSRDH